ncbi:MAG: rhomboid family intramembrane serine protease [Ilumatobacteraceae bacterium]
MAIPPPPPVPHCYRHPDREGGRNCTRCGRPACGDCLVQATVGSHCVDCARAARPDLRTRARLANSRVLTPATLALVGINVAVFAVMTLADPATLGGEVTRLHRALGLNKLVLQFGWPIAPDEIYGAHEWYRLLTAGFIHFGPFHLLMNMFLLYQLGQILERAVGSMQLVLMHLAGLFAGSLGVLLIDVDAIAGGASGAVFGLMAGAAVGMQRRGVNVFSTGIGTTLLLNLLLTFTIPGISVGGHVGGAIGGALCGWVMLAPPWRASAAWTRWAAPVGVIAVAVAASVVVVG